MVRGFFPSSGELSRQRASSVANGRYRPMPFRLCSSFRYRQASPEVLTLRASAPHRWGQPRKAGIVKAPTNHGRSATQRANDPWMTLAQAVRWAAWLDQPEPRYGSVDCGDGVWVDHGDMEEQHRLNYVEGAEKVRCALADGRLEVWGQSGYEEPQPLPKARWSTQFGAHISWIEFYHPFDRMIVERAKVLALWPPSSPAPKATPDAIAKGPPKRRGRTKGTGFQLADAPLLDEMEKAIEADPSLNPTSAAKRFADRAPGASFEAKVDRLARAYRAGKNPA